MVSIIKQNKPTCLNISTGDFSSFTEVNLNELSLSHSTKLRELSESKGYGITTRNYKQPILLNASNIMAKVGNWPRPKLGKV